MKLGQKALRRIAELPLRCLIAGLFLLPIYGAAARAFELSSADLKPGEPIPEKFTFNGLGCHGANISPELNWTNPPEGTKSFALMVHDPDAKTGGAGIWHWVIVNIPASATSIEQGAGTSDGAKLPSGSRQINNDYLGLTGSAGWGGPCPPKDEKPHHYNFTLYAIKADKLNLPPNATGSQAGFVINRLSLGQAELAVTYGR